MLLLQIATIDLALGLFLGIVGIAATYIGWITNKSNNATTKSIDSLVVAVNKLTIETTTNTLNLAHFAANCDRHREDDKEMKRWIEDEFEKINTRFDKIEKAINLK